MKKNEFFKDGTRGSVAFRRNQEKIEKGLVPEKYTRILPYIHGERVLEIGAAEGVLSLLLAEKRDQVYALERRGHRHEDALRLQSLWREQGRPVARCTMLHGDIIDHLDLFSKVDSVVAVRCIYYFLENLDPIFSAMGKHVPYVTLCGNGNRARKLAESMKHGGPRTQFYHASYDGMVELLQKHGYRIIESVREADPIVVGFKDGLSSPS